MNYLICQDWYSTTNNHAGMKYLCQYLEKTYPDEFKTIIITQLKQKYGKNKILNRLKLIQFKLSQNKKNTQAAKELVSKISSKDKIFLMEYFDTGVNQYLFAKIIRKRFPDIIIYGMSHLVPSNINKAFSNQKLQNWGNMVNKIITLGSSLSEYYISKGISRDKIVTTFHYVDKFYMIPQIEEHKKFSIIVMGNQMRNNTLLADIVKCNLDIQFIICQGVVDLSKIFSTPNVKLIPYISEEKLRELMTQADISLNVMYDTIGSNVIVTSMGMGLAMICSNVGSIKNYCDETNSILCSDLSDFNEV